MALQRVLTKKSLRDIIGDILKVTSVPETATFLDPVCKTGVFLRKITKRLIVGLESKIPSLEKRINHILKKQIFGLAITELTALTSRRTVYCSKSANGEYSLVDFENSEGNIFYDNIKHIWKNGTCTK